MSVFDDDESRVIVIVNNNFQSVTNFCKLFTETHPHFKEKGYEMDVLLLIRQTKLGQRQRQWTRRILKWLRENYGDKPRKKFKIYERYLGGDITAMNRTIIHQEVLLWMKEQLIKQNKYTHISFGKVAPYSFEVTIQNLIHDIDIIPSKWDLTKCLEFLGPDITRHIMYCLRPRISTELESRAVRTQQRSVAPKRFVHEIHDNRNGDWANPTTTQYKDFVSSFHMSRIQAKDKLKAIDVRARYDTSLVKPCKKCRLCKELQKALDGRKDLLDKHPFLKVWIIPPKRIPKRLQNKML